MNPRSFHNGKVELWAGDCMDVLREIPDNSIDAVVTDPPYALVSISKRFGGPNAAPCKPGSVYARSSTGFMGVGWDTGKVAFDPELWVQVLRVLKPGGHCVAFGGTRTYHRLACAIEDGGFEIRDALQWVHGQGFPKSHDVSKGIDRAAGVEREIIAVGASVKRMIPGADQNKDGWIKDNGREFVPTTTVPATKAARQWQGWGTALKPACEIICLARKPLSEPTVAANVLRWGTGAINVDGCRIEAEQRPLIQSDRRLEHNTYGPGLGGSKAMGSISLGRFPANLILDGSPEVLAGFPDSTSSGNNRGQSKGTRPGGFGNVGAANGSSKPNGALYSDSGSAARFFYQAKADTEDRLNSKHPTIKPVDLIAWLIRLICPKNGTVLDPFAGTGTTGAATFREGCRAVLIEREAEYLADIERRMDLLLSGPDERARKLAKPDPHESLPLFGAV